jgi:3-phosphoshikimate 1-carboxyvinyltransferase
MAMAAAVLGLQVPGMVVEDVETTDKTMPDFPVRWVGMLHDDGTAERRANGMAER